MIKIIIYLDWIQSEGSKINYPLVNIIHSFYQELQNNLMLIISMSIDKHV